MDAKHVHNLNILLEAIGNNDMGLLQCSDATTGEPAPVICIFSGTGKPGEVAVIPVARMFVGDPMAQVRLPDDIADVIAEHAKIKMVVAAMIAEDKPGAERSGELH